MQSVISLGNGAQGGNNRHFFFNLNKYLVLKYKMVREPNVSPHKQIIKDDDVKECIPLNKLKIKGFILYLDNHVISLNSIHTTPKMVHAYIWP